MSKDTIQFKHDDKEYSADGILGIIQVNETDVVVRWTTNSVVLKGTTTSAVIKKIEEAKAEANADSA